MAGVSYTPPSDHDLTALLEAICANGADLRRMLPRLSLAQLDAVASCCPWEESANHTLLELSTWARAAADTIREMPPVGRRTA